MLLSQCCGFDLVNGYIGKLILPDTDYLRISRDQRYADRFGYYEMCAQTPIRNA